MYAGPHPNFQNPTSGQNRQFCAKQLLALMSFLTVVNHGLTVPLQVAILAKACDRAPPARGKGTTPTCFDSDRVI